MFELLICAFIFYVGMVVGEMKISWHLRDIIRKEAIKEGIHVDDNFNIIRDEKPHVAKLFVEKSNNILYLYDYEANTFVCQANTVDELASLAMKYNNIKYAVVESNGDMLMFVEGVVKTK